MTKLKPVLALGDKRGYTDTFKCEVCNRYITAPYAMKDIDYDFCPYCGEKVEEEKDGEQE